MRKVLTLSSNLLLPFEKCPWFNSRRRHKGYKKINKKR
nr:MAG TPA: hypothetical protein [Caudoviricetes sp.]